MINVVLLLNITFSKSDATTSLYDQVLPQAYSSILIVCNEHRKKVIGISECNSAGDVE